MRRSNNLTRCVQMVLLSVGACGREPAKRCVAPMRAAPSEAGSSPAASAIDPCEEAGAVAVLHHAIDLTVRLDPPSLSGTGELQLKARREARAITLDARGLRIKETTTQEGSLPFRQIGDRLCVELPRALTEGSSISLKLVWDGAVTNPSPLFSTTQAWAGYNTSTWMPTLQNPGERATLALRITTGAGLTVVASGRKVSAKTNGGDQTEHSFALERLTPPFLYAFAIGHFDEAAVETDGVKLRALGPAGSDLNGVLAMTATMYRFIKSRTGAPLPSAEYTQILVKGDAAQEAATLALLSDEALDDIRKDPTDDWLFSHELAHQWFGWLVSCADFSDFWLNEGFATFLAAAYKEHRWGRSAYDKELLVWRARSAKVHADLREAPLSLSPPGQPARRPPRESELQARGITYYRGALVLHKLREELGETTFWAGVQRYVKDRAEKGARTEDFRAALELASGRDLNGFFARWVYAAAPDL